MSDAARTYGDVVGFRLASRRFYLVSHPDLIEQVLVTDGRRYAKGRGLERARRVLGNGLLTSEGEEHLRNRRLVQPHFQHRRIASYAAAMTEEASAATERWQPGMTFDVTREMNRVTMRVIGRTLFGADIRDDAGEVSTAIATMIDLFDQRLLPSAAITDRLPLRSTRRFEAAEQTLDSTITRLISDRRAHPGAYDDLLDTLLTARDEDGNDAMTDQQVRDEATTLFVAGHETTATLLSWAWYLLARHSRVEARLHEELDTVLVGRPPSLDDYDALPYTRQILSETMRLFPTVWMLGRRALEDTTIGDYDVPAKSIVMMSPWVVQRDPRWFARPTRFDPDRWDGDETARRARFAYFPFGGGSRKCLGESFAWMESTLVLALLAQRWRLSLVRGHPIAPQPRITLRPKYGIRVVVERRT
jgi:cytochrome P450